MMSKKIILQLATKKDIDFIIKILCENKLPTEDIAAKIKSIYLIEDNNKHVGIAGLEIFGKYGLIRSIVVDPALRNKGYGKSIITTIIKLTKLKKIKELYLLTMTADKFFNKLNFEKINRNEVPDEIKQTDEFNSLCPVTAVCMKILVN